MSTREFEPIPGPNLSPFGMVLHLRQPQGKVGRKVAKQLTVSHSSTSKNRRARSREGRGLTFCASGAARGSGVVCSCRISRRKRREEIDVAQGNLSGLGMRIVGDKNCSGCQPVICTSCYLYFLSKVRKKALKHQSRREKKGRAGGG